jgi:hypothetical protein
MTTFYSDDIDDIQEAGYEPEYEYYEKEISNDLYPSEEFEYKKKTAKECSEVYKLGDKVNKEILVDTTKYMLIDPIKILSLVPRKVELALGYTKDIVLTGDEQDIVTQYRYKPEIRKRLDIRTREHVLAVLSKNDARIAQKKEESIRSGITYQYNDKL